MSRKEKIIFLKILILIIVFVVICAITLYLFPVMKNLSTLEGKLMFKEKVERSGIFGILSLFVLQISQIFLFIVPGEPVEILAGMCYGSLWGTIFIVFSNIITTSIIYFFVRRYGKRFVYLFCDKRKIRKMENSDLFKDSKKIEIIVFILFLIPGTPKDFLTYIGGLLPIKFERFIFIAIFARLPSILSSTLLGANIAMGDWKEGLILYIIILIIVLIFLILTKMYELIYKYYNKYIKGGRL